MQSGDAGDVHTAELLLEFANFVAQPSGHLELQLPGRGQHLLVQLLDEICQRGTRHLAYVELAVGMCTDPDDTRRNTTPTSPGCRRLASRLRPAAPANRGDRCQHRLSVFRLACDAVGDVSDALAQRL